MASFAREVGEDDCFFPTFRSILMGEAPTFLGKTDSKSES